LRTDKGKQMHPENNIPEMKPMVSFLSKFHYPSDGHKRDLRVDFIRGFVMLVLIVVHINMTSYYN
jgi:uncharacterized membrane protein